MSLDLRLGDWREVLADVECDALITDPPFSKRTHDGHNAAAHGHAGSVEAVRQRMRKRRKEGTGRMGPGTRRVLHYDYWTPADVRAFVGFWAPRVRGWFCAITDHVLFRVYEQSLEDAGRYVFAPVSVVITGMTVRLGGDGPSNWTVQLCVARPRCAPFSTWGTLPGAYIRRGRELGHIGGKPLDVMTRIVGDYSRPGDLVVDPCAGLATTGIAATALGRRFIGAEVDPETHAKALARVERGVQMELV